VISSTSALSSAGDFFALFLDLGIVQKRFGDFRQGPQVSLMTMTRTKKEERREEGKKGRREEGDKLDQVNGIQTQVE